MSANGIDDDNSNNNVNAGEDWVSPPNSFAKASGGRGGESRCLGERVAARAGFSSAPRLTTPQNPSPYLTIPPGLSPTTLLDSPIFLSNSLVQPSPTTGKFSFLPDASAVEDNLFEDTNTDSFAFKPLTTDSTPSYFLSATAKMMPASENQAQFFDQLTQNRNSLDTVGEHSPPNMDDDDQQRVSGDSMAATPSEDGYNWRKYGQKQVKGSEYPRSYYKCTHPNCQVKKKVERSHEGHVTEIIYKGAHNHPKPPPNRRSALEHTENGAAADGDPVWTNVVPKGNGTTNDWRHDSVEVTSSTTVMPEFANVQNNTHFETGDAVDASSTFSNDEDEDDRGTHGSVSHGYDCEADESELKRRKIEAYAAEMSGATRAIREPRVVVQTTSEVDILDDGYRWRKYGQKVVKGNPNPRSYYKCTSAGCTVRKHVERASHDLKAVITTYEGKHNHDVPAARNSSHVNSGSQATHRPEPPQAHSSNNNMVRPNFFSPFSLPGRQGHSPAFSFAMSQPGLANLDGFGSGQPKFPGMPSFMTQQRPMSEMEFMLPKGEPKMEPISEPNTSAAAVYQQMINRLPLGPQM